MPFTVNSEDSNYIRGRPESSAFASAGCTSVTPKLAESIRMIAALVGCLMHRYIETLQLAANSEHENRL
jgi:hypothetical protein